MKKISVGILAHVDARKTTLSESILYNSGTIRNMGRVDNKDAFLDTDAMEKDRGITIFSKQAVFDWKDTQFPLIDTPGHEDFVAETERVLGVIDYAILLINAADGVTAHTETLFRLLEKYAVPTVVFLNKMDYATVTQEQMINELNSNLSEGFAVYDEKWKDGINDSDEAESIAVLSEDVLEEHLETGNVSFENIKDMVIDRKLFPCFFGSALKNQGVTEFMDAVSILTVEQDYPDTFGPRVFKISRDEKKNRLTFMKITGGKLSVRQEILMGEKVDQIRVYSGAKYSTKSMAEKRDIIAVTGLVSTYPGQAIGFEENDYLPILSPLLSYRIILPEDMSVERFLPMLREIAHEEPLINIDSDEKGSDIKISIMGEVQLEILERQLLERFNVKVSFDSGKVLFKETIKHAVYGVGHYEPLRHYAEVHLLLRPLPPGSGIVIDSEVSVNDLAMSYQNEIISSIRGPAQRGSLRGVIAGLRVTDIRVTLVAGKIHLKHTEGGDLREASIRSFRAALISGEEARNNILLEPFMKFRINLPDNSVGRIMNDINEMGGKSELKKMENQKALIEGIAPVRLIRNYQADLTAYTHGSGKFSIVEEMYLPSGEQEKIREDESLINVNYKPENDRRAPVGSLFCSGGSGYYVDWREAMDICHLEKKIRNYEELKWLYPKADSVNTSTSGSKEKEAKGLSYDMAIGVDEIDAILNRALSANKKSDPFVKRKYHLTKRTFSAETTGVKSTAKGVIRKNYLLVDGYNIIHRWDSLKGLVNDNMLGARMKLLDIMSNYQAIRNTEVVVVFDAYHVPGDQPRIDKYQNINVVYTKEAETADQYIAKFTNENVSTMNITVATSDFMVQLIIRGAGAVLMSATELEKEIEMASKELREQYNIEYE